MQRIIAVVTTSDARDARRRGMRDPTRERERRARIHRTVAMTSEVIGEGRWRKRHTLRCNREWRENATIRRRREDDQRERHTTAREAQADTRAREACEIYHAVAMTAEATGGD